MVNREIERGKGHIHEQTKNILTLDKVCDMVIWRGHISS